MIGAALGIAGLGMSLYDRSQSAAANRSAKRYLENQKRTLTQKRGKNIGNTEQMCINVAVL